MDENSTRQHKAWMKLTVVFAGVAEAAIGPVLNCVMMSEAVSG